jgi:hypothetical protein
MKEHGTIEGKFGELGMSISQEVIEASYGHVLSVLGCFFGDICFDDFILSYDKNRDKLIGVDRWLSERLVEVIKESMMSGWDGFSQIEWKFSMEKSTCSACNKHRRLMGFDLMVWKRERNFDNEFVATELMNIAKLISMECER